MLPVYLALILVAAISPSAAQCTFSGEMYSEGESIPDVCSNLVCAADGSWTFQGFDENCDTCTGEEVLSGISVASFDNPEYSPAIITSHCRVSLAQEYNISSSLQDTYEPAFGVFVETNFCNVPETVPCFDFFVVRSADGDRELHIPHSQVTNVQLEGTGSAVAINEIPQTLVHDGEELPFIGWIGEESGVECSFIQGSILLTIICPTRLQIKVQPSYYEQIGGLCGYYDGNPEGDHILRDGSTALNGIPVFFTVISLAWMTEEQDECDLGVIVPPTDPRYEEFVCFKEHPYTDLCETALFGLVPVVNQLAYFYLHRFCEYTLCADPEHYRNIIPLFEEMVKDLLEIDILPIND